MSKHSWYVINWMWTSDWFALKGIHAIIYTYKKHLSNSTVLKSDDARHSPTGPGGPWGPGTGTPRESWNVLEKRGSFRRSGVKTNCVHVLIHKSLDSVCKPNSSTWKLKTGFCSLSIQKCLSHHRSMNVILVPEIAKASPHKMGSSSM